MATRQKARKLSKEQDASGAPQHGSNVLEVEYQLIAAIPTNDLDPFQLLNEDILRHIFSYLLCLKDGRAPPAKCAFQLYSEAHPPPSPDVDEDRGGPLDLEYVFGVNSLFHSLSESERAEWDKLAVQDRQRYEREEAVFVRPHQLLNICIELSLVSKHWMEVVGDMMNASAPVEVISPQNLFQLKCRVLSLDPVSVCKNFLLDIKERWGSLTIRKNDRSVSVLKVILENFAFGSEERFCNIVAREYVHFLAIKCVEELAFHKAYKQETPVIQMWKERCQPPKLVDLFWQSHMRSPKKYARDCNMLLGGLVGDGTDSINNIIDHNAEYTSMNLFSGSDYESKKKSLFQFEQQLSRGNVYIGTFGGRNLIKRTEMLFSESFDVCKVASELLRLEESTSQWGW